MEHLKFDGRYKDALISGRKRATIRLNRVSLNPGDEVLIHSGGYVLGFARIRRVERKKVRELTDEDAKLDGFRNRGELIRALGKHYRNLSSEMDITLIEFELVEKFQKPVLSADFPYEGNLPLEIAEKALKYLDLQEEDERLIRLFLREGSLRKAAYKLGGLHERHKIRKVLRRAYEELKSKGIMEPKFTP
ncbi:MAG: ASCH domain-containing protein [Palaeococcus sp.]|uniref:ASCH domain-containing protein n=1 Tax=Palaeococcus sp. (in: euryarchaeotes) TaxID=2820298 RepID=UPI0025FC8A72|nr:ASCH domain-containing protein [Palaeococcus sp. (in: euryarchaeotes)]MCD6559953.1 ASCH domain-containing protein [Palaeococcus sp. (in: euryarchaeotes)]